MQKNNSPFPPYGNPTPTSAPNHDQHTHQCSSQAPVSQAYGSADATAPHLLHDQNYYQYGVEGYDYYPAAPADGVGSWFDFSNSCYLKGFLIGAGATLLLTNSSIQKTLVKGTVKLWSIVQGGVEEVKEQFQDVKAEMSQEK